MVEAVKEFNLMVAGVGGQGSILLSHIIGNAAIRQGYQVRVAETYGASMRGGAVHGHIRIGQDILEPLVLEDRLDALVALEPLEGLRVGVRYLSPQGIVVLNARPLRPMDVSLGKAKYPNVDRIVESLRHLCRKVMALDATKLAEEAGSSKTLNIVILGGLTATGVLPISIEVLKETIEEHVPKGTEEMNLRAFELGRRAFQETALSL